MSKLNAIITDVGRAAVTNKHQNGFESKLSYVEFGDAAYTPSKEQTHLNSKKVRLPVYAGEVVEDGLIHVTALGDGSGEGFAIREVGFFLEDDTLLAVYSHSVEKIADWTQGVEFLISLDLLISSLPAGSINVTGGAGFTLPPASTTKLGLVEIATKNESVVGSKTDVVVTPEGLREHVQKHAPNELPSTENISGIIKIATITEAYGATNNSKAMTSLTTRKAIDSRVPSLLPKANTVRAGLAERATTTEARSGYDDTRFVSPKGMRNHGDTRYSQKHHHHDERYLKLSHSRLITCNLTWNASVRNRRSAFNLAAQMYRNRRFLTGDLLLIQFLENKSRRTGNGAVAYTVINTDTYTINHRKQWIFISTVQSERGQ